MRLVMTLMVRDEADIIGSMIEHHRAQGVDHVLVTDNASNDGTLDVLRALADEGFVTLWHDPEHRKQQFQVVTRMARYAHTELGADWVINADADEFFVSRDASRTVRDELAAVAEGVTHFSVPVVNLTGEPARDGTGLSRLVYRDERSDDELRAAGIPFHPTADSIHRGHPEVTVSQGNHFVTAPGWGDESVVSGIEVLHLPWRSWRQYQRKVAAAGAAYEANPELFPSPRHHGMQDYRRLKAGRLEPVYVAKHAGVEERAALVRAGSLSYDGRLSALEEAAPAGLRADVLYDAERQEILFEQGRLLAGLESEMEGRMQQLRDEQAHERALWGIEKDRVERQTEAVDASLGDLRAEIARAKAERERLETELAGLRGRFLVKLAHRLDAARRRIRPSRRQAT